MTGFEFAISSNGAASEPSVVKLTAAGTSKGITVDKRSIVGWKGYLPAITTPFARDGAFDARGFGSLLEWLEAEGMHGLLILGTTGEWTSLAPGERVAVLKAAGTQLGRKMPLLAGCSAFTAIEVLQYAAAAQSFGFDGILVTPPPYIRPNEAEILAFYGTIAAGTPLPICIYNWPPGTGIDMPLHLLAQLADLPNVVAIKQSTPHRDRFFATFFALRETVRIFGHSMDEHGLAILEAHGGDGTMGAGAVLGRVHADFYNCLWAGDIEGARENGRKDRAILDQWYTPDLTGRFASGPAIMKAGLNAQGLPGGHVRPPLLDVSEEFETTIRETLVSLGRFLPG